MKLINIIFLLGSLFGNIKINNYLYEQTVTPVVQIIDVELREEVLIPPYLQNIISFANNVVEVIVTDLPEVEDVIEEDVVEEIFIETAVSLAEARLEELPSVYGQEDILDLIDVERVLSAMTIILGREPTHRELIYMTIWTEYWSVLYNSGHNLLGQEAVARSYYQFCGTDGCVREELIRFLSGYRPWFEHPNYIDADPFVSAEYLLTFLHEEDGHEYNYIHGNGAELYRQVDEILDFEFAEEKTWTGGKYWNRPSQWAGPMGPPPKGSTFGYSNNDFAIVAIPYYQGAKVKMYFVTYYQELYNFTITDHIFQND